MHADVIQLLTRLHKSYIVYVVYSVKRRFA